MRSGDSAVNEITAEKVKPKVARASGKLGCFYCKQNVIFICEISRKDLGKDHSFS